MRKKLSKLASTQSAMQNRVLAGKCEKLRGKLEEVLRWLDQPTYLSTDPGGCGELIHGVEVALLHIDTPDDEFFGFVLWHVVQVEGIDLGCQMTADLIGG